MSVAKTYNQTITHPCFLPSMEYRKHVMDGKNQSPYQSLSIHVFPTFSDHSQFLAKLPPWKFLWWVGSRSPRPRPHVSPVLPAASFHMGANFRPGGSQEVRSADWHHTIFMGQSSHKIEKWDHFAVYISIIWSCCCSIFWGCYIMLHNKHNTLKTIESSKL